MDKTRRKITPIARKRRNFAYFLLAILFAITTGYIFFNFSPEHKLNILNFGLPIIPFFLISFFFFIYSILRFVIINATQAGTISIILLSYLVLRVLGLTHWIFAVLFIALLVTSQLFIIKKK